MHQVKITSSFALEHVNRVYYIKLSVTGLKLEKITTVMQEPFTMLRNLVIVTGDLNAPVLHAEFLGGSAPMLEQILLEGISYPALPTLLLSTSDLVVLELRNIPPKVTSHLGDGASQYLEDLVARIDAPQLASIDVHYLNQLVEFRINHLAKFIERSVGPKFTLSRSAKVGFESDGVGFYSDRWPSDRYLKLNPNYLQSKTQVICEGIDYKCHTWPRGSDISPRHC